MLRGELFSGAETLVRAEWLAGRCLTCRRAKGGNAVADLVRFSVSLEADLLSEFDRYCKENRFATRSEAIRQLLRDALTEYAWTTDAHDAAATLTLVYDHHRTRLTDQLLELQHQHTSTVVASSHVHLDHDNCLEVIFLRGQASRLREIASQLRGLKGIRKGQLVVATTAETP
jgi:CopG family nickel-responsive transcriptional regulator